VSKLYTIDFGTGQWMIAKLTNVSVAGYHVEDSRGNKVILPQHSVTKLTERAGW
jgi:hypothetical protein